MTNRSRQVISGVRAGCARTGKGTGAPRPAPPIQQRWGSRDETAAVLGLTAVIESLDF